MVPLRTPMNQFMNDFNAEFVADLICTGRLWFLHSDAFGESAARGTGTSWQVKGRGWRKWEQRAAGHSEGAAQLSNQQNRFDSRSRKDSWQKHPRKFIKLDSSALENLNNIRSWLIYYFIQNNKNVSSNARPRHKDPKKRADSPVNPLIYF